jgi:DNA-binding MarR family transcriptional regulator
MSPAREDASPPGLPAVRDSVDDLLDEWRAHGLPYDFSPVGVVTRLNRVRARLDSALAAVFAEHALTPADFEVVVVLRRQAPAFEMTQSRLMAALVLTSGTVSVRIDRLVRSGIVVRRPDPSDRRGAVVALTAKGSGLFDVVVPQHLRNEDRLLAALDADERRQLADLLRKLLVAFESEGGRGPRLAGMTLEPAHVTRRLRAAAGLPEITCLLVTAVAEGSTAHAAGVAAGDFVVAADALPVRGHGDLRDAFASGHGTVDLEVLRGEDSVTARLPCPVA